MLRTLLKPGLAPSHAAARSLTRRALSSSTASYPVIDHEYDVVVVGAGVELHMAPQGDLYSDTVYLRPFTTTTSPTGQPISAQIVATQSSVGYLCPHQLRMRRR